MSILNQSFPNPAGGCCTNVSLRQFSASQHDISAEQDQQLLTGEDQLKKQEIDTLISEAFKTLSFQERQVQQEQLHGVADEIAEEASIIENSLLDLESHIQKKKAGSVYEMAERMNPDYVHARAFRIMFLRANRYDAKAAAKQMMTFLEFKQELFGTERLIKDITIDDLDEDDLACMKSGSLQWAGRDSRNRPIFLNLPGLRNFKELKNELRYRYFVTMEAAKSQENQIRGIVFLMYTMGDMRDSKSGHGYKENSSLAKAIPLYPAAFHLVSDDPKQYLLGSAVVAVMPVDLRARFRLHLGTHLECQYLLSTFGIPPGSLPFSPETNSIELESHLRWCQKYISDDNDGTKKNQMVIEPESKSNNDVDRTGHLKRAQDSIDEVKGRAIGSNHSFCIEPNSNDVLYAGTTKAHNNGNARLRSLVRELAPIYTSASIEEKRIIVDRMIHEIHETGGRFLQQADGQWHELPAEKVRPKITQWFRNLKSKQLALARRESPNGPLISGDPLPADVLFGRFQKNRGNEFLTQLIKEQSKEYDSLDRGKKQIIVDSVVKRIKAEGGRFLQSTDGGDGWVELSQEMIRTKVSRCFRNYRRPSRKSVP